MTRAGLDLGGGPGDDLGVVDVVDGDVDADLLAPAWANGSNQSSAEGTKWLHSRMRRLPDSAEAGSLNTSSGASLGGSVVPGRQPRAATEAPTAARLID